MKNVVNSVHLLFLMKLHWYQNLNSLQKELNQALLLHHHHNHLLLCLFWYHH